MAKSRIKINPVTMEMEIEVSDSFLKKYFQKLTNQFSKSEKVRSKIKSNKAKTKPASKTRKKNKIKPSPVPKRGKGSIQNDILERIKSGKSEGVSIDEIAESTALSRGQIYHATKKLKSKGFIRATERGKYTFIMEMDATRLM